MTNDPLWSEAIHVLAQKLPNKQSDWLFQTDNQRPFTASELLGKVTQSYSLNSTRILQRFFAKVDPIISHLSSFSGSIDLLVQNDLMIAGTIWAAFHLLIQISCRAEKILVDIVDYTWEITPYLHLFRRWRQLFPNKEFEELTQCIRAVYLEVLEFWIDAIAYFHRGPLLNRLYILVKPQIEWNFKKRIVQIGKLTKRIKDEVDTAHMQSVQQKLNTIEVMVASNLLPRIEMYLPTIRIIPHSQNPRFFGRAQVLNQIHDVLNPSLPESQRRFILAGPPGSGKTQIALEYTYQNLSAFKAVIWVLADNAEKIEQGFRDVADLMGMPAQNSGEAKSFVLHRLAASDDNFLLCFDNADDLSLIQDFLPRSSRGSILVTTRDASDSGNHARDSVIVQDFSEEEACDFLASLMPHINKNDAHVRPRLAEICNWFQGYPLALSQAAGFIRTGGFSLEEFIKIFKDQRSSEQILALPVPDYHATFATVWEMSHSSLPDNAKRLLDILSYLDPDNVPYELLTRGAEIKTGEEGVLDLGYLSNPLMFHAALQDLTKQSIIRLNVGNNSMSIHRYLQKKNYEQLCNDDGRCRNAFEETLYLLSNVQPKFDSGNRHMSEQIWEPSKKYVPHIKVLGAHFLQCAKLFEGLENQLGNLMYQCGVYQFENGYYNAARATFKMVDQISSLCESPDIVLLSDCKRIEGRMFNELNQAADAAAASQMALDYAKKAVEQGLMPPNDARISRILTGYGNSLSQLREFERAAEMQLQAFNIRSDLSGDNDLLQMIQLNWGTLLYRQGNIDEAERILLQILDRNPDQAIVLYPLGNIYLALNRREEALNAHFKALELYIERFGLQHSISAVSMFKVGQLLLQDKHEPSQAIHYLRQSLDCFLMQDSQYYNKTCAARGARMLAIAFQAIENEHEAQKFWQLAWDLKKKITGIAGSTADTDDDYSSLLFYWDQ